MIRFSATETASSKTSQALDRIKWLIGYIWPSRSNGSAGGGNGRRTKS